MTLEKIIEEAKIFTIVNGKETFVFERENEYFFCDLKTLNSNINERHEKIRVICNIYQNSITRKINPFCPCKVSFY